jgi:hypothetical protein
VAAAAFPASFPTIDETVAKLEKLAIVDLAPVSMDDYPAACETDIANARARIGMITSLRNLCDTDEQHVFAEALALFERLRDEAAQLEKRNRALVSAVAMALLNGSIDQARIDEILAQGPEGKRNHLERANSQKGLIW